MWVLKENTPARIALEEAERPTPRGRPPCTWLSSVKRQLNDLNVRGKKPKTEKDGLIL